MAAQAKFTPAFWDSSVSAINAALLAIDGMKGSANPFAMLLGNVTDLQDASNTLRNTQLPALSANLVSLNTLYTVTIGNFTQLVDRLRTVNATVMQLPAEAANGTTLLANATSSLQALYSGTPSPMSLPDMLALLAAQLAPPVDTSDLTGNATGARDQLNNAPDPTGFSNYLTALRSAIQATQTPSQQVNVALDAFIAASPAAAASAFSNLQAKVSNAQPSVGNLATATANRGSTGSTMINSLRSVQDNMAAFKPALDSQRGAVATADVQVALYPNTSSYQAALQAMGSTYAALGSPPSKVGGQRQRLWGRK